MYEKDSMMRGLEPRQQLHGIHWFYVIVATFIAVFVGIFTSFRVVPAAHTAVVSTFGTVWKGTLESGLHVVYPWSNTINFQLKTQLVDSENVVPTQEGLNVELDVAILFRLDPNKIRDLYLSLGVGYTDVLSAKALYTSGRRVIQTNLFDELEKKFSKRGIILEDVLLKAIKLPKLLTDAIESKAKAEQEAARMEFVLSKEEQEATRKQIEAKGIATFQHIVSEGISEQLLQWKGTTKAVLINSVDVSHVGIEATERLAESDNAKIVIMGNSGSSLPVLLSAPGTD